MGLACVACGLFLLLLTAATGLETTAAAENGKMPAPLCDATVSGVAPEGFSAFGDYEGSFTDPPGAYQGFLLTIRPRENGLLSFEGFDEIDGTFWAECDDVAYFFDAATSQVQWTSEGDAVTPCLARGLANADLVAESLEFASDNNSFLFKLRGVDGVSLHAVLRRQPLSDIVSPMKGGTGQDDATV